MLIGFKKFMFFNKKLITIFKKIKNWLLLVVISFCIALSIHTYIFDIITVDGKSMENTFYNGEVVIVNKLRYKFCSPKRGDIIVFAINEDKYQSNGIKQFENSIKYIKRIVAIKGDILQIKKGNLYINNKKIQEPYVNGLTEVSYKELYVKIPENKFFVLGDNREDSKDSRDIGLVDYSCIYGRVSLNFKP